MMMIQKKMVFLLIALMMVSIAVAQQPPSCGDGIFNAAVEECDDFNNVNGDGCSATCQLEDYSEGLASLKLLIGHNLLFSKVMDLLHIIKDQIFQLEFKVIEITLVENECDELPPSFALRSSQYMYGKLDEIDHLVKSLISSWKQISLQSPDALTTAFGPDASSRLSTAATLLVEAKSLKATGQNQEALICDCEAVKLLAGTLETQDVTCT